MFSEMDKRVLRAMKRLNRFSSTTKIASRSKMSWATAVKVLRRLKRMGIISSKKNGRIMTWKLNF